MDPPVMSHDLSLELTILLDCRSTIDLDVVLDQPQIVLADDHPPDLLPERLRQPHEHLARTHDMLPLLPLLGELRHLFDTDVLALQRVELQMQLIYQIKDARIAVADIHQRIETIILDDLYRWRETAYLYVRHELTCRIRLQDLPAILHR